MTKFSLQISCNDAAELAKVVALLTGTTSLATVTAAPAAAQQQPAFNPPPPATVPATTSNSNELDSKGLPWDARIHSETKAKNKDGSWRGRRGVDDATINAVTAELHDRVSAQQQQPAAAATVEPSPEQVFDAPAAQQQPAFNPAPSAAAVPDSDPMAIPAFLQRQPAAAVSPPPPPVAEQQQPAPAQQPAAAPSADAPLPQLNFQQLMSAISQGLRDKKIDNVYLGQLVTHYQLPSIPALATSHASLIPQVIAALRQRGVV